MKHSDKVKTTLAAANLSVESELDPAQLKRAENPPKGAKGSRLAQHILKGTSPAGAKKRPAGKMTTVEAIEKVLADADKPLGPGEIAEQVLEHKLVALGGKTPEATIKATAYVQAKNKGSAIKRTKRGFSLA